MSELSGRLISWAQNEEMIDQYYTDHGKDCMDAAEDLERLQAAVDASAEVIHLEDDDDPCEDASGNLDLDKMDDYQRRYNAAVERWVAATRRALDGEVKP
jgi:hypothetical protein